MTGDATGGAVGPSRGYAPVPEWCVDQDTLRAASPEDLAERADVAPDTVTAVLDALAEFEADRHPWRDPRELVRLYYLEGLTQAEVADELGCRQRTVHRWMETYDVAPGRGAASDPEANGRQSAP